MYRGGRGGFRGSRPTPDPYYKKHIEKFVNYGERSSRFDQVTEFQLGIKNLYHLISSSALAIAACQDINQRNELMASFNESIETATRTSGIISRSLFLNDLRGHDHILMAILNDLPEYYLVAPQEQFKQHFKYDGFILMRHGLGIARGHVYYFKPATQKPRRQRRQQDVVDELAEDVENVDIDEPEFELQDENEEVEKNEQPEQRLVSPRRRKAKANAEGNLD